MIGHVIDIEKVELVKAPFEHCGDKVTVFEIYKCLKNCCFIKMCKAHIKVTHIKQ